MTVPQQALTRSMQLGELVLCREFAGTFQIIVMSYCGTAVAVPYRDFLFPFEVSRCFIK